MGSDVMIHIKFYTNLSRHSKVEGGYTDARTTWKNKKSKLETIVIIKIIIVAVVKVNLSPYRPWRPLGLLEVEAPIFSDIRLTDGGKVASHTRRPLSTPRKILGTYFC
jgi:hypothetical protein